MMGLTMLGAQIIISIYLHRRTDATAGHLGDVQEEFGTIRQEINAVSERLARFEGNLIGRQRVGNGALTQTGDE